MRSFIIMRTVRSLRPRVKASRRALVGVAAVTLAIPVVLATTAGADGNPGRGFGDHHATLYVSPSGVATNSDSGCSSAAYAHIQDAVDAAKSGETVHVCAGNYAEQVTISTSGITLSGEGATTIIDPTSATPSTVSDLDTATTTVPVVEISPGTVGVDVENLTIDGSGLSAGFAWPGCADNFVGVFFQASSGSTSGLIVQNVELPPALFGCQQGLAIEVQAGLSGRANVSATQDTISNYDKGGIVCNDSGVSCDLRDNTIRGVGPTSTGANGVQIGSGATGSVQGNAISANDYAGPTNSTEPQADYAAGVLLYGAAGQSQVDGNTLTNDQIAVEVVHSDAQVNGNNILETSAIDGSVGIFAVPCDYYCSYFNLAGGNQQVGVTGNTISLAGAGTTGIWIGDGAASSTGSVNAIVAQDAISGAENNVVLGPTATGTVSIGRGFPDGPGQGFSGGR